MDKYFSWRPVFYIYIILQGNKFLPYINIYIIFIIPFGEE